MERRDTTEQWQIKGLARCTFPSVYVSPSTYPQSEARLIVRATKTDPDIATNTTNWTFSIIAVAAGDNDSSSSSSSDTTCSFTVANSDPRANFYGVPCDAEAKSGFTISWGYNGEADSAVMTVC